MRKRNGQTNAQKSVELQKLGVLSKLKHGTGLCPTCGYNRVFKSSPNTCGWCGASVRTKNPNLYRGFYILVDGRRVYFATKAEAKRRAQYHADHEGKGKSVFHSRYDNEVDYVEPKNKTQNPYSKIPSNRWVPARIRRGTKTITAQVKRIGNKIVAKVSSSVGASFTKRTTKRRKR